jgi:hypothetical protein
MEPKVTDRVDAVSEAGASEMMREVNIKSALRLIFNVQSSNFNVQTSKFKVSG